MSRASLQTFGAIAAILAIAAAFAIAGSDRGETVGGIPAFALCAIIAVAIQWLVFIPSFMARTEHYFDLTGGITYVTVAVVAVVSVANWEWRSLILAALIIIWAGRLSSFLFRRVRKSGGDRRFEKIKTHLPSFLMTWTLQGLWVLLTSGAALAAITTSHPKPLEWVAFLGIAVWVAGFTIEVLADSQKQKFRADAANSGRFITTGLWSWSRHPNYFGEIVLWTGIALIAAPAISGWQWITMISPFFVVLLLTRISGIPLLERGADRRWGEERDYQSYKARTSVLVPLPPGRG